MAEDHYSLLSYLGSILKGYIVEIGTGEGDSSAALSTCHKVFTFDIIDKVKVKFPNITYFIDNLWEPKTREKYKDLLLNADLIFIDVDPHGGMMELEIYIYLYMINYEGMILFDEINYFEGMRKFWEYICMLEDGRTKMDLSIYKPNGGIGLICGSRFHFICK